MHSEGGRRRGRLRTLWKSPAFWLLLLCALVCVWLLRAPKPWNVLAADPDLSRLSSLVKFYGWWAAAINAALLAALAASSRIWARDGSPPHSPWLPSPPTFRWFIPLVVLAMTLVAAQGLLRINQSLWDDEDTSVRRYIHGELRRQEDGSLKWKTPSWQTTFFQYDKPTNHQLQSILSRATHDLWKAVARPGGLRQSEAVMRIPVLIFAVTSVLFLALLLRRLGFPRAGAIAAILLALHPWHVRYSVELRGYLFVMALLPLCLWMLIEAIERRGLRWWLGFGLAEFLLLYANPITLHTIALANMGGLVCVILRNRGSSSWWRQPARMVAASTLAGMAYLQLMLPCLPQLAAYLKTERALGALTSRWRLNIAAHFFSGIPWNNSDSPASGLPELKWLAESSPGFFYPVFAVAALLLFLGLARIVGKRPAGWLVALLFAVPPLTLYSSARMNGNYLYEWYLIAALPGVVAAVAVGLDLLSHPLGKINRLLPALLAGTGILFFSIATSHARIWLLTHSLQPQRESVLLIRPSLDPWDPRQGGILTGSLNAAPRCYDPNALPLHSMEAFVGAMRLADATGRPFYVNYGNLHAAAVDYPNIFRMIEDERLFERIAILPGLDASLERHIRKYRPGALTEYPIPKAER